jgi:SAM-dependent methyltransferase
MTLATPPTGATTLGGFNAVDDAPSAGDLVSALDAIAAFPAVQRLRAAAVDLLAPRLGDRLVDVGCGTGDQVRTLAAAVGPDGAVLGVDSSATMLAEARRRTPDAWPWVEYRLGDATALDIDDASVDGARCERVFQHLADPATAMAELVRITRPGGQIVVIDTDWGMHVVRGADPRLTARVLAAWADLSANGRAGSGLAALFAAAGVVENVVLAETFTSLDPRRATSSPFPEMAAVAQHAGALTPEEAEAWLAQLADGGQRREFFWAVTMFTVAGRRPPWGQGS